MLVLPATVTLAEARDVIAMLTQALRREPEQRVVVDASGLLRFDSSVLSVLLECRRWAQASGRGFAVRGATARLTQLARLHGVEELFEPDTASDAPAPAQSALA